MTNQVTALLEAQVGHVKLKTISCHSSQTNKNYFAEIQGLLMSNSKTIGGRQHSYVCSMKLIINEPESAGTLTQLY